MRTFARAIFVLTLAAASMVPPLGTIKPARAQALTNIQHTCTVWRIGQPTSSGWVILSCANSATFTYGSQALNITNFGLPVSNAAHARAFMDLAVTALLSRRPIILNFNDGVTSGFTECPPATCRPVTGFFLQR